MPETGSASWSTDPRARRDPELDELARRDPDVAPFLQNLAMSLGGYVAIFAGEFAQFPSSSSTTSCPPNSAASR